MKSLTSALARYTQDVNTVTGTADKREPEYVLYDTATTTLNIYRSLYSLYGFQRKKKIFHCRRCVAIESDGLVENGWVRTERGEKKKRLAVKGDGKLRKEIGGVVGESKRQVS